ncbi:MAG TPA: NUDIX domain-containing protein [Trebonia sp.]|jgi:8-oxo-dGTP pyrophosphatase MutT (NUDIX family)|nr:NUDIX domain-containing protein [Trebonia sp.]
MTWQWRRNTARVLPIEPGGRVLLLHGWDPLRPRLLLSRQARQEARDPRGGHVRLPEDDQLRRPGRVRFGTLMFDEFYFSVGGAAEKGETLRAAAAREMREEIGVSVDEAALGDPIATSNITWSQFGVRIIQDQEYYAVAVSPDLRVTLDGMGRLERSTVRGYEWLSLLELLSPRVARAADPRLPEILTRAIAAVGAKPDQ